MTDDAAPWELTPEGNIRVFRMVAFRAGVMAGLGVSLRVEFEAPEGEEREAEQMLLTPAMALRLAAALQDKAAKALAPPPDGSSRH